MPSAADHAWTDREVLRGGQYRTDANLRSRQSIYSYGHPQVDLPRAVIDLLDLSGWETVVDVGCGNGTYLAELARRKHRGLVVGVDLSRGMLRAAASAKGDAAGLLCADATALPLVDGPAQLLLAMHMLYHVPHAELAVSELRRVTAPSGRVVVGLNGHDHFKELERALDIAWQEFRIPGAPARAQIHLDDGQRLMSRMFASTKRHDFEGELVLDDPAPLESYLASSLSFPARAEVDREQFLGRVSAHIVAAQGMPVRVTTHSGCLICC